MVQRAFSACFGTIVRKHRRSLGLTQEAVADRAGIHPTHVGLVERGQRTPSLEVAWRLAGALDVTLEVLIAETQAAYGAPAE